MNISKQHRYQWLPLLIILLLGLILRLISLNQSFWLDETITAKIAYLSPGKIFNFLANDFNPPVYYLIVSFWQDLFGSSEIILRIPSLFFALATILITFKIGQIYLNSHAKLAALLLATSPLHIYYSQEARAYALAAFLFSLTAWLFLKSLKNKKFWWLFSLSLLGLLFSHYQTWLALPIFPIGLFLILREKRILKENLFYLGLSFLPIIIILFFYWPILSNQLNIGTQIEQNWKTIIGNLTVKNISLIAIKFIVGRISINNKSLYILTSLFLVFLYWGLVLLGLIKFWKKKNQELLLPITLFLPLLLGIAVSTKISLLSYFRFLFLLPFFYLLLSAGILVISSKQLRRGLFCLIVSINLICSLTYLTRKQFHREDWRLAIKLLKEAYPQIPVYIHPKVNSAFVYYNRQDLKQVDLEEFDHYNQINLISYGLTMFDPENKARKQLKDKNFEIVWGDSFNQVGIEKWQKKEL